MKPAFTPPFEFDWNAEHIDKHRRGIADMTWAGMQPQDKPNYYVGDIVEFKVGGFGIIDEVNEPHGGWPSSYSTTPVSGLADITTGKRAWHYEGDFKRLAGKSPIRNLTNES